MYPLISIFFRSVTHFKWPVVAKSICRVLPVFGVLAASLALAQENAVYTLNEGDVIHISVWGEPNLNQETLVLPDGSLSFPLVGNLDVRGLSAADVEDTIAESLNDYLPDSEVAAVVISTQGNRIYVLGKVNIPGEIAMTGPLTLVQALSLSGGLATFADESEISILRNSNGTQERLEVKYKRILTGKDFSTNYLLRPGDTILVP